MPLKTPSVPGLERGLWVLEFIAAERHGLTFSQIAQAAPFPKSSVHCMLLTLVRLGYLHRDELTGAYSCTLKLGGLAHSAGQGVALRETATPFLLRLAHHSGLAAHLAVLSNDEGMLVAKVESHRSAPIATWVGKRIDLHCTSLGKCLTAWLPPPDAERMVKTHGLIRYNENTITGWNRLKRELDAARMQGYAVDDEEEEIGVRCVGAPVFSPSGAVVAAVSVCGRIAEVDRSRLPQLGALVSNFALEAGNPIAAMVECESGMPLAAVPAVLHGDRASA